MSQTAQTKVQQAQRVLQGVTVPYSQESEEAVIGAVLINASIFPSVEAFLKVADFYILRHAYIWQAMTRLMETQEPIDLLTVCEALRAMGRLDEIGGSAYLTHLANNVQTSVHGEIYGRLVERAAIRRELICAADEIKALAQNEELTVDVVANESETKLINVTERLGTDCGQMIGEAAAQYLENLRRQEKEPSARAIPTGYRDLDELWGGGLHRGEMTVIAARPNMGKTALLLCIAMNAARMGAMVGFFTMEMRADSLMQRMYSIEAGINGQRLRNSAANPLTDEEQQRLTKAMERVTHWPLYIDDTPGSHLDPSLLRAKVRRLKARYGLDLVIIDYLQKMSGGRRFQGDSNRVQEVSYLARSIKDLALEKDIHIPIMIAAQLNRACEQRQDKRPILSDLRESGEIEQEADTITFIYRDAIYNDTCEFPNSAELITTKQRNGPTGTMTLYFERTTTKFMDGSYQRVNLNDKSEEDILF